MALITIIMIELKEGFGFGICMYMYFYSDQWKSNFILGYIFKLIGVNVGFPLSSNSTKYCTTCELLLTFL